jgi:hypothetical protein
MTEDWQRNGVRPTLPGGEQRSELKNKSSTNMDARNHAHPNPLSLSSPPSLPPSLLPSLLRPPPSSIGAQTQTRQPGYAIEIEGDFWLTFSHTLYFATSIDSPFPFFRQTSSR